MDNNYTKKEKAYKIKEEYLEWECRIFDATPRRCLVIMPIGKKRTMEYKNNMLVFNKIIKPCVEKSGYKFDCYYADIEEKDKSGNISKNVFEGLRGDDLVIADLRRSNVNVYYELGIRHTFGKRSILISHNSEVPFYFKNYKTIKYNINGNLNNEFYKRIKNQIKEIVENPDKPDNPVVDMIGIRRKLNFNSELQVYTDEKGDRFCPNCYDNNGGEQRITLKDGYTYHCLKCKGEYIDLYKKKEHLEKIRSFSNKNRMPERSGYG
ncbi:MAG: hypothetical protein PHD29_08155 [bacterium]|nr:hypothetical protein [bacterium]MDD5354044.1 hypothetical protein [bacterium]MDD5756103.1 hypothetical protein [bacterium]